MAALVKCLFCSFKCPFLGFILFSDFFGTTVLGETSCLVAPRWSGEGEKPAPCIHGHSG
jgi:hypothetical protein